jgi:hypothetical protein
MDLGIKLPVSYPADGELDAIGIGFGDLSTYIFHEKYGVSGYISRGSHWIVLRYHTCIYNNHSVAQSVDRP